MLAATSGAAEAVPFPDGDDDGYVDFDEARRSLFNLRRVDFDKYDLDGDGVLDRSEFAGLNDFHMLTTRDR
ncbi:MAG: hypothetical protein ABTQ27_16250 [Amaricoccus sp.]|uniref:hypothetical protein n=1 Tax=Amaricoccus sp. TaxID=1872485 RepID=UPI00331516D3